MALDPLEKEHLRQKLALRMRVMTGTVAQVECVSGHYHLEPILCELCGQMHTHEQLVIRNRAGNKFHVAIQCLREMIRFQVVDVEGISKWLAKMRELKADALRRAEERAVQLELERRAKEKKVIVRKRTP